jgi:DNA-binding protein HU-beta
VVNKTDLIDKLAETTSLSKADAGRAVDALFDVDKGIISSALQGGSKVQITGFGTFETRRRGARMGRNPRTGERIQIPASVSPAFRAGKGLKDGVKP